MDNYEEFLSDIQTIQPEILSYDDAFSFAMDSVPKYYLDCETLFFGAVGTGTFFSNDQFDDCRWFPESRPGEVVECIRAEFGDGVTDAIRGKYNC